MRGWSGSQALARFAASPEGDVDLIAKIALSIPGTDNIRVNHDLAMVAAALPAAHGRRFVEKAVAWIDSLYGVLFPDTLGKLVQKLASEGEADAALDLARALLALDVEDVPDDDTERGVARPRISRGPGRGPWDYARILRENVPALLNARPEATLRLLAELLETAVAASKYTDPNSPPQDYSWIWARDLDAAAEDGLHGVRGDLVTAVRRSSEFLVQDGGLSLAAVIEILRDRKWLVFDRLALHLLARFPDCDREATRVALLEPNVMDSDEFRVEYTKLVGAGFPLLSEADRAAFVRAILAGPRPEHEQAHWDEDTRSRVIRRWQFHRLHPIAGSLSDDARQHYDALREAHPGPIVQALSQSFVGFVGPTAPVTQSELDAMPLDQLLDFLRDWKPTAEGSFGRFGASREGIARLLVGRIKAEPDPFAIAAPRFEGLHFTYITSLFEALQSARAERKAFEWRPVLELALWVVSAEERVDTGEAADEDEGDWSWTWSAIARFLEAAMSSKGAGEPECGTLSREYADLVWPIIERLCRHPDPTPETEERYGGSNMDPFTMSLNTTRGKGVHCAMQYATWRGRIEPNVTEALDERLDPTVDPSLPIRSVFGQRFVSLFALDRNWIGERVARIFPPGEGGQDRALWRAAWSAYIVWCEPFRACLEMLRAEYRRAIDRLGEPQPRGAESAEEHLAEHLLAFYVRGDIELEDELLSGFFARASAERRAKAIETIGRWLDRHEDTEGGNRTGLPPEQHERTTRLWEARFEATRLDPQANRAELGRFGWWFQTPLLDEDWRVARLAEVVGLGVEVEAPLDFMKALADAAPGREAQVLGILAGIAATERGMQEIGMARDEVLRLLAAVIDSDDRARLLDADALLNEMGRKGAMWVRAVWERVQARSNGRGEGDR